MSEHCLKHFDSYLLQLFADYQITNISMGSNLIRIFLKFIGIHFLVMWNSNYNQILFPTSFKYILAGGFRHWNGGWYSYALCNKFQFQASYFYIQLTIFMRIYTGDGVKWWLNSTRRRTPFIMAIKRPSVFYKIFWTAEFSENFQGPQFANFSVVAKHSLAPSKAKTSTKFATYFIAKLYIL